jgi:glycosyltransferase involved in cell wall biosynthesis
MVLFLESFYGGSHRAFADGLIAESQRTFDLRTLPGERWRQRTRAAAFHFGRQITSPSDYEAVLVTDLIDLADLCALWRGATPPLLLYMHESQSTYPLPKGETQDIDSGLRDIRNALHADRVVFNSAFHRERFLEVTGELLQGIEHLPAGPTVNTLTQKSAVVPPGIVPVERSEQARAATRATLGVAASVPLIMWNHRWEYDKRPDRFFGALRELAAQGIDFRLCLLGENPQYRPQEFDRARRDLGHRIVHWGFEADRERYRELLAAGDIVVSTAIQENFGIAVAEAISAGCFPLLPNRLSYPEVLPTDWHPHCLYGSQRELVQRLRRLLGTGAPGTDRLAREMERYSWRQVAPQMESEIDTMLSADVISSADGTSH